jgi:hypothetical protein
MRGLSGRSRLGQRTSRFLRGGPTMEWTPFRDSPRGCLMTTPAFCCLRLVRVTLSLGAAAALFYCQLHEKPWYYSGGQVYYTRGWPFPFGGTGCGFHPGRLVSDVIVSSMLVVSVFTVTFRLPTAFRLRLGPTLRTASAFVLTLFLLRFCPSLLWPGWEPPIVRVFLILAAGCAMLCVIFTLTCCVRATTAALVHRDEKGDITDIDGFGE